MYVQKLMLGFKVYDKTFKKPRKLEFEIVFLGPVQEILNRIFLDRKVPTDHRFPQLGLT